MKNSIKHTKDLLILSMVFILSSVFSNIQANNINSEDIKVSGVVQDQTGVELPGVSISVKGMDKGTITNASGEFSIMVPPNATLIVSFVGMETKEVDIKGRRNIVIVLEESSVLLDEVVAIGYGKQSRALITNSISKINKEEFQKHQDRIRYYNYKAKFQVYPYKYLMDNRGQTLKYLFVEVVLLHLKVILP